MLLGYVNACIKRNKNDAADAEVICEAATRPSMRFVPMKTADQQSVLMLHRARGLLVRQRTLRHCQVNCDRNQLTLLPSVCRTRIALRAVAAFCR